MSKPVTDKNKTTKTIPEGMWEASRPYSDREKQGDEQASKDPNVETYTDQYLKSKLNKGLHK